MPHKDPAAKLAYMREYYRKNREAKRAQIKESKRKAFERDPDGSREKWRMYRANARRRAALRELEAIKAEQAKRKAEEAENEKARGYRGELRPNGF